MPQAQEHRSLVAARDRYIELIPQAGLAIVAHILRQRAAAQSLKRRIHDSKMTGEMKVAEWLTRHDEAMRSQLGVIPATFRHVLLDLETMGGLAPTRYVSTSVQLAIFLYICREGLGLRHAGECFQRSLNTISMCASFGQTLC